MRLSQAILCAALLSASALTARIAPAQTVIASASETHAITTILSQSADDWNRGDLDAFATSYKNSPDILFMGRTIQHGYTQMLARYKEAYPTRAAMGTLSFTQLAVQPLDTHFATVTGRFHLERTSAGGGNAGGYFLLVLEHTSHGWKIVRDDSTSLSPPTAK